MAGRTGAELGTYLDLHRWSVGQLEQFWGAVWDFFDIAATTRAGSASSPACWKMSLVWLPSIGC